MRSDPEDWPGRGDRHYVLISSDMHGGADIQGYKPYLERQYHEEFDAWASHYSNPWRAMDDADEDLRIGVASYGSPVNWDSSRRVPQVEAQGIAAEVLFPNTTPPFYPSGALSAPPPGDLSTDRHDYELRFAGIRAHNRWLADFCREMPGRRAGMANVFLTDLDDTLQEVRRAREDGLAGVLLPADTVDSVQHLYYPKYDALWALSCDLDMPVGMHGIIGGRGVLEESGPAGLTMDLLESGLGPGRSITSLIMSGVFDRFPTLRWVQTERGVVFASDHARRLDAFVALAQAKGTMAYMISRDVVAKLKKKPSEYVATNCYFGSFLTDQDLRPDLVTRRDHIMWGADYPHHEGVVPWTIKALRRNFAGWPEHEVRQVLAGTAAECYGFDLAALQSIADRIGPTVDEVSQPLTPAEVPRFPDETICPTFVDVDPSMGLNRARQENPETVLADSPLQKIL